MSQAMKEVIPFQKSQVYKISKLLPKSEGIYSAQMTLASHYARLGKYGAAAKCCQEAISIAKGRQNTHEYVKAYLELSHLLASIARINLESQSSSCLFTGVGHAYYLAKQDYSSGKIKLRELQTQYKEFVRVHGKENYQTKIRFEALDIIGKKLATYKKGEFVKETYISQTMNNSLMASQSALEVKDALFGQLYDAGTMKESNLSKLFIRAAEDFLIFSKAGAFWPKFEKGFVDKWYTHAASAYGMACLLDPFNHNALFFSKYYEALHLLANGKEPWIGANLDFLKGTRKIAAKHPSLKEFIPVLDGMIKKEEVRISKEIHIGIAVLSGQIN